MSSHMLISPGKFGLGFAGDLFARIASLDTLIVSRSPTRQGMGSVDSVVRDDRLRETGEYVVEYEDNNRYVVNGLRFAAATFHNPEENILDEFLDPNLSVITVSVPETGLNSVAVLLAAGLHKRWQKDSGLPFPVILPFVNTLSGGRKLGSLILSNIDQGDEEFASKIKSASSDCVIDRICSGVNVDENGILSVFAERFASLIVEDNPHTQRLRMFAEKWKENCGCEVLKLVPDLQPWSMLKYWGLNGLHLLLASLAKTPIFSDFSANDSPDLTPGEVALHPAVNSLLAGFMSEVSLAIRSKYPGAITREEAKSFLSSARVRVSGVEDTVNRLLKALRIDSRHVAQIISESAQNLSAGEDGVSKLSDRIVDECIGEFLEKVNVRLLMPTFHLSAVDGVYPINLGIGTASVLHAISQQIRSSRLPYRPLTN